MNELVKLVDASDIVIVSAVRPGGVGVELTHKLCFTRT